MLSVTYRRDGIHASFLLSAGTVLPSAQHPHRLVKVRPLDEEKVCVTLARNQGTLHWQQRAENHETSRAPGLKAPSNALTPVQRVFLMAVSAHTVCVCVEGFVVFSYLQHYLFIYLQKLSPQKVTFVSHFSTF